MAGRSYQFVEGMNSPDYVLMFMPVESALTIAVNENPGHSRQSIEEENCDQNSFDFDSYIENNCASYGNVRRELLMLKRSSTMGSCMIVCGIPRRDAED
ncbi:MAG: hypothetical protein IPG02_11905 [Ignavibacteria bacterium]|nr:hypothetical protein [Ignavibacteria bacterium]